MSKKTRSRQEKERKAKRYLESRLGRPIQLTRDPLSPTLPPAQLSSSAPSASVKIPTLPSDVSSDADSQAANTKMSASDRGHRSEGEEPSDAEDNFFHEMSGGAAGAEEEENGGLAAYLPSAAKALTSVYSAAPLFRKRITGGRSEGGDTASDASPSTSPRAMPPSSFKQRQDIHEQRYISTVRQKVLSNLGVLSDITTGDKLHMTATGNFVIHKPSWYYSFYRMGIGCSRDQTLEQVVSVIDSAQDILRTESDPYFVEWMNTSLRTAAIGLRKLQETYQDDTTFKNRIDVVIQRVET